MSNIICKGKLELRFFNIEDAKVIQRLANDLELAKILRLPNPYLLEHAINWIESQPEAIKKGTEYPYAITEQGKIVGTITLRIDLSNNIGELGYWIGREFWGRGIATEAVKMLIKHGFEELSLHKIHASVIAKNSRSQKVLEKAGLCKEGIRKEHRLFAGGYEDVVEYGLLRSEYSPFAK